MKKKKKRYPPSGGKQYLLQYLEFFNTAKSYESWKERNVTFIQRKNKIYRRRLTYHPNMGLTENDYKSLLEVFLKLEQK